MLLPVAAQELGISHVSVWRHVKAGRLKARKVGPIYLVRRADLEAFKADARPVGRPRKAPPKT